MLLEIVRHKFNSTSVHEYIRRMSTRENHEKFKIETTLSTKLEDVFQKENYRQCDSEASISAWETRKMSLKYVHADIIHSSSRTYPPLLLNPGGNSYKSF